MVKYVLNEYLYERRLSKMSLKLNARFALVYQVVIKYFSRGFDKSDFRHAFSVQNSYVYRWYPAKRALSAMRKHGG